MSAGTEGRRRSFWGWGWADKFPDEAERKAMGEMVASILGFDVGRPAAPPRIDDIALRAPRVEVPDALAAFTSAAPPDRIMHTYGKGYRDILRGFRGDFSCPPDLVARPRDEAEVGRVLDWASDARVAVIPFGGGTSVVAGVEPDVGDGFRAAVSLDLGELDRVLEIDERSLAARIQAGATGPHLEAQLAERGLTLRHFPQSFEFSTLGGWIATRAGGHFATVYTHIDDLVESTRMLTPRGAMESRRLPGSGAGPSPDRLVLGSEGAFGVITEAWMRVRPRPVHRATATVRFDGYDAAGEAVRALSQSGLFPTNCRLLDAREAALNFVTDDGSHVLIVGFESADHALEPWMARALELCRDHGGRCPEGPAYRSEGERAGEAGGAGTWKQAFVEAPYLMNVMVSLGVIVDTFETAVTWDRFEALHAAVLGNMRDAMKRLCGGGTITCRFTHVYPDGPAPYYTFLAPGRAGAELEQWTELKRVASDTLLAHGATITHHHAVGRLHRPWYERQRPAPFADALRAAKGTLDPAGVLNPGVLL
ncbi:MAG: FAD-binding oxidoreductase [Myxococcota bacterium]